jgi:DNA (cytosine-5)-methyltransferase 1
MDPIKQKIRSLRHGRAPRLLDLFAGCGGLTLGFVAAGYDLLGAVEFDPIAVASYSRNFHRLDAVPVSPIDIQNTSPRQLAKTLQLASLDRSVDIIIGGPPCQAFARVGRAKLREIAQHPSAFRQDERGNLYLRYLQYIREFKPIAILMENVPDVLNYGGHNVAEEVAETLDELGYVTRYTLLNTAFYGVPQMRERMFLIAIHRLLDARVQFPSPTHWVDLPRGYEGSRRVALRTLGQNGNVDSGQNYFVPPPSA